MLTVTSCNYITFSEQHIATCDQKIILGCEDGVMTRIMINIVVVVVVVILTKCLKEAFWLICSYL